MWSRILNTLLPNRCLRCEVILSNDPGLCSECWASMQFITSPYCSQCGLPLEVDLGREAICGDCARGQNYFSHVQSVFVYNDTSKDLILKFKHGDAHHGAPIYAQWMVQAQNDLLDSDSLLAPVPLHWTRLFRRCYNQSQILAKELSVLRPKIRYIPDLLIRNRATVSQGQLSQDQRYRNISGSINIHPHKKTLIKGKRIVLIDDVMTSGATMNVCAKALLKAGATDVNGLTLGRVTRT